MMFRIKCYFNLGTLCFIIGLILTEIGEVLTVFVALAFNLMVYRKFRNSRQSKLNVWIAIASISITFLSFLIQYQYRRIIDWGCLKHISDFQANTSYLLTAILFSTVIWETGISLINRISGQILDS